MNINLLPEAKPYLIIEFFLIQANIINIRVLLYILNINSKYFSVMIYLRKI